MFDIGALELLVVVIVAVMVIGPKDMPMAMRTAGRWIGKVRRVSAHFRTGIDAMVREAELEDMEKQWKARNEEIMRQSAAAAEKDASAPAIEPGSDPVMTGPPPVATPAPIAAPAPTPSPTPQLLAASAPPRPAAKVVLGGNPADLDPVINPDEILPARPHIGDDDVQG